jgi:mono/diheme cytochrome c family protein
VNTRFFGIAAIVVALPLVATAGPARAQQFNPLEQRGRALLTKLCSECHAVGRTGQSPRPQAPPFRSIAQRYEIPDLVEQFRNGFTGPHPDMPTSTISRDAARAVQAYLYAIQK